MKCVICQKGPEDGVALYRQNETGVQGIWACAEHRTAPVDPEVQDIVDAIEADNV